MAPTDFYWKRTCGTCRKAKDFLENHNVELIEVDILTSPPTREVLEQIIDKYGVQGTLHPKSAIHKEMKSGKKTLSKDEAIKLMMKDPNLIKRPVVKRGEEVFVGFDKEELKKLT